MKTLYIECSMGASGDMIMGALLELHPDPADFLNRMNALGIPTVRFSMERVTKCGISGTHAKILVDGKEEEIHPHENFHGKNSHEIQQENFSVNDSHEIQRENFGGKNSHEIQQENFGGKNLHEIRQENFSVNDSREIQHENFGGKNLHEIQQENFSEKNLHENHHHEHNSLRGISELILSLPLAEKIRRNALSVFGEIASAEGKVHGRPMEEIHFHEVGTMDAVADVVGVCAILDELGADEIFCSAVNTGSGSVECAHGILPVPAPATSLILQDVPIYSDGISGELCTPTGAAILKHFVKKFCSMPVMRTKKIGYGFGTKNFPRANCIRIFSGETENSTDTIAELSCNLDDMSGERISFAAERLFEGGALDVFTVPVGMKKNRPGILLTCLCSEEKKSQIVALIFRYTTTIGIREKIMKRYVLERHEEIIKTNFGEVRAKKSEGYGVAKLKAEFDDLKKLAVENGVDVSEISEKK
jgi:hypothetical protein